MPKWVDDCAKSLMADPDFKPEDPEQTKEQAAWAVCQARYKQRAEGSTVTLELVNEPVTFTVAAEDHGELLRFRNAVLVVAEENRNKDVILEEELQNLARTLPGRPIDDEHAPRVCVGVFTEASVVKVGDTWGLSVGGLIWADRFPEVAQGVRSGRLRLSIEADAERAECSICGLMFERALDYCKHLLDKAGHNASRILRGLRAVGGAVTGRPAGTDTDFDLSHVYFVASHGEEETIDVMDELQYEAIIAKQLSHKERQGLKDSDFALIQKKDGKTVRRFPIHDCSHARNALSRLPQAKDISEAERAKVKRKAQAKLNSRECKGDKSKGGTEMEKTPEELQKELEEMARKYDVQLEERQRLETELAEVQASLAQLTEQVGALTADLEESQARNAELVTAHRRELLAAKGLDEETVGEMMETVASMDDAQFSLVLAHVQKKEPSLGVAGGFKPPGGADGGKEPLTL